MKAYRRTWKLRKRLGIKPVFLTKDQQRERKNAGQRIWELSHKEERKAYRKKRHIDHREARNASTRKWQEANPEIVKKHNERFNSEVAATKKQKKQSWLLQQENRCPICKVDLLALPWRQVHLDHDHSCCPNGKSCAKCERGVLCSACNNMLGQAKESVSTLQAAIDYLQERKLKSPNPGGS